MDEFVAGFDALARIPSPVAVFGSSRARPADPAYTLAERTGRLLAEHGYAAWPGAARGSMGGGKKARRGGGGRSVAPPVAFPGGGGAERPPAPPQPAPLL